MSDRHMDEMFTSLLGEEIKVEVPERDLPPLSVDHLLAMRERAEQAKTVNVIKLREGLEYREIRGLDEQGNQITQTNAVPLDDGTLFCPELLPKVRQCQHSGHLVLDDNLVMCIVGHQCCTCCSRMIDGKVICFDHLEMMERE